MLREECALPSYCGRGPEKKRLNLKRKGKDGVGALSLLPTFLCLFFFVFFYQQELPGDVVNRK
jgi:hypothetical protein